MLLLHTGLRLSELVALDIRDVRTSARKGVVIVRSGKGDAFREVALNATARDVVDTVARGARELTRQALIPGTPSGEVR